jgi:hypothetical protein
MIMRFRYQRSAISDQLFFAVSGLCPSEPGRAEPDFLRREHGADE